MRSCCETSWRQRLWRWGDRTKVTCGGEGCEHLVSNKANEIEAEGKKKQGGGKREKKRLEEFRTRTSTIMHAVGVNFMGVNAVIV